MILSGAREARAFGAEIAGQLSGGQVVLVHSTLSPYLTDKNPFRLLDLLGAALSPCPQAHLFALLDRIADDGSEGGWVVIASALRPLLNDDPRLVMDHSRQRIIQADIWYAADIFGERVPGPFLLADFSRAQALLSDWRADRSAWIRRAVGVAVHFWAKRTKSDPSQTHAARQLLQFLDPLFEEKDLRAAKGIGWGLKTLGRYYPDQSFAWLQDALIHQNRRPLAVVKRKALTWLPEEMKRPLQVR